MRYLSDDGIEFDTEKECREHEEEIKRVNSSFILYDADLNIIEIDDCNRYEYIHIISNPEEVAGYLYHQVGWGEGIEGIGIYQLCEDGIWRNLDNQINEHERQLEFLKSVKKNIENM